MQPDEIRRLLEEVKAGRVSPDEAQAALQSSPVAELGYRHGRSAPAAALRLPGGHLLFGQDAGVGSSASRGSSPRRGRTVWRRASPTSRPRSSRSAFPQAEQDRLARTFWLPASADRAIAGKVVILTAGTSDLPVAQEAAVTAKAIGCEVDLIADVGVAGLHRLLRHRERFHSADAIVVVAGWDGALPSVVGGLVDCPVIAGADEHRLRGGVRRRGTALDDAQRLLGQRRRREHR